AEARYRVDEHRLPWPRPVRLRRDQPKRETRRHDDFALGADRAADRTNELIDYDLAGIDFAAADNRLLVDDERPVIARGDAVERTADRAARGIDRDRAATYLHVDRRVRTQADRTTRADRTRNRPRCGHFDRTARLDRTRYLA